MKQLAKTLLILGSVAACERASDVRDTRPERAVAQPLVDPVGRPAVGNIGQSGRPAAAIAIMPSAPIVPQERTVVRPVRPPKPRMRPTPRRPAPVAPDLQLQTERVHTPLLTREGRPASGNVPTRHGGNYEDRQERIRLAREAESSGDKP